jgi:AmmeMemoRadiSam system protein A
MATHLLGMDTADRFERGLGPALLGLARRALEQGPRGALPEPDAASLEGRLGRPGASFVTLTAGGLLRGCCGHLEPTGPLGVDVWRAAHASAYRDPRFPPVTSAEIGSVRIEVSVLGSPEPMACRSEPELLAQLRPGEDGLIVTLGAIRATFLPKVWASLTDSADFVRELRRKAGLPADFWSEDLRWSRYRVDAYREAG